MLTSDGVAPSAVDLSEKFASLTVVTGSLNVTVQRMMPNACGFGSRRLIERTVGAVASTEKERLTVALGCVPI